MYKVIGTNYSNPAIREALETVSELYSASEHATKPVELDQDDSRAIELGKAPLTGGTGTAARARKSLRRDAELKLTQASRQFLQTFQEVDKV